jgi:hypothetical protein
MEYLEDDVLSEYYETNSEHYTVQAFVLWAYELHARNGMLELGLDYEALNAIRETAAEFESELDDDEHDYIHTAEALLNYYRQAWAWDNEPVARLNVRKKSAEAQARIVAAIHAKAGI